MSAATVTLSQFQRRVYDLLCHAAENDLPCPSNLVLAERLGFQSPSHGSECLAVLEKKGLIRVHRGNNSRVVEVFETGRSTSGAVPQPHWRAREGCSRAPRAPRPAVSRISAERRAEEKTDAREDLAARIDADQARQRAAREQWLQVEQAKYRLPRRGRLLEEMPA